MFCARACDADACWQPEPEQLPALAALCRSLEGIPLCLELAASHIRELTPEEMLTGLSSHRDRIVASDDCDIPARQRTLHATLDWSYTLLTPEAQAFLAGLSVFAGGFYHDAVEQISGNPQAFELLLTLHRHSLLFDRKEGGRTRYSMLDAVRHYAAGKLRERDALQLRHAGYYAAQAETCLLQLRTREEAAAIRMLRDEAGDLQAAWQWSAAHDDTLAARISIATYPLLTKRGFWDEAQTRSVAGLAAARRAGATALAAQVLLNLTSLLIDREELVAAQANLDEAMQAWRTLGDNAGLARALNLQGLITSQQRDFAGAQAFLQQALELKTQAGDRREAAMSCHNLGVIAQQQGEYTEAQRRYEEALAIREEIGDQYGSAETLCNLGALAEKVPDFPTAHARYTDCLRIWCSVSDDFHLAIALHNLQRDRCHYRQYRG